MLRILKAELVGDYRIEISWQVFAMAGFAAMVVTLATASTQAIKASIANPVDGLKD